MIDQRPIVIVHLGRKALGESARLESWRSIVVASGRSVHDIGLRSDHPGGGLRPIDVQNVLTGRAVPETLAWDVVGVRERLVDLDPQAVIHLTLRSYEPRLRGPWDTVLDFVDRLSNSYRSRSEDARGGRRMAFRLLGYAHGRAERLARQPTRRAAAGLADAMALGARWIPNVIDVDSRLDTIRATHDLVFFGNLAYAPNRLALERFGQLWPTITARRPDTSVLVGGANGDAELERECVALGWTWHGRFDDPIRFARRGRIAIAPMTHAAGIQNKVIEAAAADRPQVLSREAAGGLAEPPPGIVADDDEAFVNGVLALLDDPGRYPGARNWVDRHLSPRVWVSELDRLLEGRTSDTWAVRHGPVR